MSETQHQPLQFVQNRTFPLFQLCAVNGNKKTPPLDAMKISVLTAMEWLREKSDRSKDKSESTEFDYPAPSEYEKFSMEQFRPIHIQTGHTIDAVWLPEEQSFSLQIIEDDMGSPLDPDEPPVPGRKYITNVGIRIVNDHLEYGFKAEITEPKNVMKRPKYLRMGIIKRLVKNDKIRLSQSYNILMDYYYLATNADIDRFDKYLANRNVHLPVIVFSACEDENAETPNEPTAEMTAQFDKILQDNKMSQLPKADFSQMTLSSNKISVPEQLTLKRSAKKSEKHKQSTAKIVQNNKNYIYPFSENDILDKFVGFAHIFRLPFERIALFNKKFDAELNAGDAVIVQPICFGKEKKYFRKNDLKDYNEIKNFMRHIYDYLRTRNISYRSVIFYNKAAELLQQKLLSADMSKENLIDGYELQIKTIKQNYDKQQNDSKREIRSLNESLAAKNSEISDLKSKISEQTAAFNKELTKQKESFQKIENYYKDLVDWYKKRILRPTDVGSIPKWLADNYSEKIFLHNKAKALLENWKPSDKDMIGVLYDALEYLGSEYYDCYFKNRTEEEINLIASQKYGRPFDVTRLNSASIFNHPQHYKVKYLKNGDTKSHEVELNYHLRYGVKAEHLIRIYFFIDEERKLIVIGSLPEHLPTTQD